MYASISLAEECVIDHVDGYVTFYLIAPKTASIVLVSLHTKRIERLEVNKRIMAKSSHVELSHSKVIDVFPVVTLAKNLRVAPGAHVFHFHVPIGPELGPSTHRVDANELELLISYELIAIIAIEHMCKWKRVKARRKFQVETYRISGASVPASVVAQHMHHARAHVEISNVLVMASEAVQVHVYLDLHDTMRVEDVLGITITLFSVVTVTQKGEWSCEMRDTVETQQFSKSRGIVSADGKTFSFSIRYMLPQHLQPQATIEVNLKDLPERGKKKGTMVAGGSATRVCNIASASYKLQVTADIYRRWENFDGHLVAEFDLDLANRTGPALERSVRQALPVQLSHSFIPIDTPGWSLPAEFLSTSVKMHCCRVM